MWCEAADGVVWPILVTDRSVATPRITYLGELYEDRRSFDRLTLHQAKISEERSYLNFGAFVEHFLAELVYPIEQKHKIETFGWCPTWFVRSERPSSHLGGAPEFGWWRRGSASSHMISVMYLDLDNHHAHEPHVSIQKVEHTLMRLGFPHVLYTSFSHTENRHKVRAMMPINRNATYQEAYRMYQFFNWLFDDQLDPSIYDDGDFLYAPPFGGVIVDNSVPNVEYAIDVDAMLRLVVELAEEHADEPWFRERTAPVAAVVPVRSLSPQEVANRQRLMANRSVMDGLSIDNPHVFNPVWMEDISSRPKGHRQTMMSLLTKCWMKSGGSLSFGDLGHLQHEIDVQWAGYCERKYGRTALSGDIKSIMRLPVEDRRQDTRETIIERELKRISRK